MPLPLLWVVSIFRMSPDARWMIILRRSADEYFRGKEASDDGIHPVHTSNSGLLIHTSANSKTWMITAASAQQRDKHCEVRFQFAAHATMNQQCASITSRSTDSQQGSSTPALDTTGMVNLYNPPGLTHTLSWQLYYCLQIAGITMSDYYLIKVTSIWPVI